jgi:hypothetical protein
VPSLADVGGDTITTDSVLTADSSRTSSTASSTAGGGGGVRAASNLVLTQR